MQPPLFVFGDIHAYYYVIAHMFPLCAYLTSAPHTLPSPPTIPYYHCCLLLGFQVAFQPLWLIMVLRSPLALTSPPLSLTNTTINPP
ncbi:hypothetical protein CANCADRAFT_107028, partial [Tortispora caseinolytica NRRL Y-17796]